jgi:hypothetical protein
VVLHLEKQSPRLYREAYRGCRLDRASQMGRCEFGRLAIRRYRFCAASKHLGDTPNIAHRGAKASHLSKAPVRAWPVASFVDARFGVWLTRVQIDRAGFGLSGCFCSFSSVSQRTDCKTQKKECSDQLKCARPAISDNRTTCRRRRSLGTELSRAYPHAHRSLA